MKTDKKKIEKIKRYGFGKKQEKDIQEKSGVFGDYKKLLYTAKQKNTDLKFHEAFCRKAILL